MTIQKAGSIPAGPSGELEWQTETTLQKENLDQSRPNLAGSSPAPDIGFSQVRAALIDLRLLFRSYKRIKKKEKKLREKNRSEWICCSVALFKSDPSDGKVMTC